MANTKSSSTDPATTTTQDSTGGKTHGQPALRVSDSLRADAAGAFATSVANRLQLAGRVDHLPGCDRPDRAHPGRLHEARPAAWRVRRLSHRKPRRQLVRGRSRATGAAGDHLAASACLAGGSAVPDRGLRVADAR